MAYTLTGQYVYGNGAPRRGRIKFAPSVAIAGDATVILPSPLTVDLDSGGSFSVPLVGTDDDAYSPSGWVWSCTEVLDGGRTFSFELTADSDIHTLTPVAVPDEYSVYVEVGAELAASLTSGDATLLQVPLADGSGGISWGDQSGGSGGGASLSDTTPLDLGTAAAGTGVAASREDHVHDMPTAADVGASAVGHGHSVAAGDLTDVSTVGEAVATAADAAAARTAIGAGTSDFDGAYSSLSGQPTLGTAAAAAVGDFASAAQGATADSAVQPGDLGTAAALDVGTTTGTVAAGDDARLSDARTPTEHKTSHADGGSDELDVADLASGAATAGQAPLADGTGGVAWGDVATSAGGLSSPTFTKSGYYLGSLFGGPHISGISFASTLGSADGLMVLTPFWVPEDLTVESVGCNVTRAATDSGSVCRFGLYSPDAASGPSTLDQDFGTVSIETTGEKALVVNRTLSRGLWWVGMKLECPTIAGANPDFYGNQIHRSQQSVMNSSSLSYASFRCTTTPAAGSLVASLSNADLDWAFNYHHPRILVKVA